jgi:hypothetical protein
MPPVLGSEQETQNKRGHMCFVAREFALRGTIYIPSIHREGGRKFCNVRHAVVACIVVVWRGTNVDLVSRAWSVGRCLLFKPIVVYNNTGNVSIK